MSLSRSQNKSVLPEVDQSLIEQMIEDYDL